MEIELSFSPTVARRGIILNIISTTVARREIVLYLFNYDCTKGDNFVIFSTIVARREIALFTIHDGRTKINKIAGRQLCLFLYRFLHLEQ